MCLNKDILGSGYAPPFKCPVKLVKEGRKEGTKLGLCATLLAPPSIDAWRAIWGVSD